MKLSKIWRFPIKSLSGSTLPWVVLNSGLGLPHDRRWALARPYGKAASDAHWHPKSQFFVQVREGTLAELKCEFDDRSGVFSLRGPNGLDVCGKLATVEGRNRIAKAVAEHLGIAHELTPVVVEAQQFGYFDSQQGPLSILNTASLGALETALGRPLNAGRFRMNLHIEGGEAWAERDWIGKQVRMGGTLLQITENTGRCKTTHLDLDTGKADVNVLKALTENFGHTNMGVYAKVIDGGRIQPGDEVEVLD